MQLNQMKFEVSEFQTRYMVGTPSIQVEIVHELLHSKTLLTSGDH